jgi:hypothetical protein
MIMLDITDEKDLKCTLGVGGASGNRRIYPETKNSSKKCVLVMTNLQIHKPPMQNHFSL